MRHRTVGAAETRAARDGSLGIFEDCDIRLVSLDQEVDMTSRLLALSMVLFGASFPAFAQQADCSTGANPECLPFPTESEAGNLVPEEAPSVGAAMMAAIAEGGDSTDGTTSTVSTTSTTSTVTTTVGE